MIPDWKTSKAGARIRAALWLVTEIGEGGIFTKSQLREAFPHVEQVDRRMRDLRPEGWSILTVAEDVTLAPDELRLARVGGHVWEPGYQSRAKGVLTAKERQEVFRADGYQCILCGTAGGESYADDPSSTAKLTVSRLSDDGSSAARTLCDRCRAGKPPAPRVADLRESIEALTPEDRRTLAHWLKRDARERSQLEDLWAAVRALPASDRAEIRKTLE
jgi:hypothetical protein